MNGASNEANHLVLDNFLALWLNEIVREVLAHVFVSASGETDDRLAPGVANVNTD